MMEALRAFSKVEGAQMAFLESRGTSHGPESSPQVGRPTLGDLEPPLRIELAGLTEPGPERIQSITVELARA